MGTKVRVRNVSESESLGAVCLTFFPKMMEFMGTEGIVTQFRQATIGVEMSDGRFFHWNPILLERVDTGGTSQVIHSCPRSGSRRKINYNNMHIYE